MTDTERQLVTHISTFARGMLFQLPLLYYYKKIHFGWLCHKSFDASVLQETIEQLPEQVERGKVILARDDLRAEAAQNPIVQPQSKECSKEGLPGTEQSV